MIQDSFDGTKDEKELLKILPEDINEIPPQKYINSATMNSNHDHNNSQIIANQEVSYGTLQTGNNSQQAHESGKNIQVLSEQAISGLFYNGDPSNQLQSILPPINTNNNNKNKDQSNQPSVSVIPHSEERKNNSGGGYPQREHNNLNSQVAVPHSPPMTQQINVTDRKTISSQFQNFLKENLIDSRLIDGIDRDFIIDDTMQEQDDPIVRDNIFQMKKLLNQEDQLLTHFCQMSKLESSLNKIKDLFEACYFELTMRNREKAKLLDQILVRDDMYYKTIKSLDAKIQKYENEILNLKMTSEIRTLRQTGRFRTPTTNSSDNDPNSVSPLSSSGPEYGGVYGSMLIDSSGVYDWVVDIDLITNIGKDGWKVTLSEKFFSGHSSLFETKSKSEVPSQSHHNEDYSFEIANNQNSKLIKETGWEGATVAVVGLYDKGKTFVLNNLTQSNLPSGKKVNTKGISFKHVNVDSGTNLILVDTAGSYSPVKIQSELSIVEKQATEMFILDLVFEVSDYFICVVNDFTSLDQRYLDKLSRNLQNSPNQTFREILVIHNLKDVESEEILQHIWENQVTQIYHFGSIQKTKVAAVNPNNHQLQEKHVIWFQTLYTRHICLVNHDCPLGMSLNPWVFSLLRYWLKAVFVPVNRQFSVVDSMINYAAMKLSSYFRTGLSLQLYDTEEKLVKRIQTKTQLTQNVTIPQISIDSSGLIMTRPDNFQPAVDIIANDKYLIYMDLAGMNAEDLTIYRQNVITIVQGTQKRPYTETKKLEKNERKYGDFTLSFRIPQIYQRKWSKYTVENGVLLIQYDKDGDQVNKPGQE